MRKARAGRPGRGWVFGAAPPKDGAMSEYDLSRLKNISEKDRVQIEKAE